MELSLISDSSAVKLDPPGATWSELERWNVPIWLKSSTYTPPTSTRDKNVLGLVTQSPQWLEEEAKGVCDGRWVAPGSF